MKITLGSIPEEGIQHTFSIDGQSFAKMSLEKPDGFSLKEARVVCLVSRIGERLYIKGDINALFLVECSRCSTPTDISANDVFDYVFVPKPQHWESDVELSPGEMDEVFYDGDTIDLTDIVVEQINLLAPAWVLCRDDCQGLCPVCGKNKNEVSCSCAVPQKEARFAALRGLKVD